jgi:alkylresorcinol/alkylpyrone synthase
VSAERSSQGEFHAGNPNATIASTAIGVPQHVLSREIVKQYFGRTFSLSGRRLDAVLEVVDNAKIDRRYSILPVDELIQPRSLSETSRLYREHALKLGGCVAQRALDRAGMTPADVDMIVTVSCTGVMIPSLDAYLANQMGFRADVRRLPITELGCAAGAAGLTRAWEYLRAYPQGTVLLIAVELPTLTLQRGDLSQANLISAVLFGDGAAAAVITGRPAKGPCILDGQSHLFPDSLEAMGFELRDRGFHIVLSKEVPELVRDRIGSLVDDFLARSELTREDLKAYILHPGGQKLLGHVQKELGLRACQVEPSWNALRDFGNLSSASVLFVLHEWLERAQIQPGERGLLAAFGPGFSAEMLLLQWT